MLICIFRRRIGTPTGKFESGSIEEIEEHIKNEKSVMIYFSVIAENKLMDTLQSKELESLKKKYKDRALFAEYTSIEDFQKKINKHLAHAVNHYFLSHIEPDKKPLPWVNFYKSSTPELSEFDIERITTWTNSNQNDAHITSYSGDRTIYNIGKQYEARNSRECAEWSDFFERLLNMEFVGKNGNGTFSLKRAAYDYVDSLNQK